MKHIKIFLAFALMAVFSLSASAQDGTEGKDYKPFPHMFVGIQGGVQTTFTNYDQMKLITPTASVYFGGWFTPIVGARLHVNGIWNKGGYDDVYQGTALNFKYDYRYVTTNVDLLLNLCTLFGKKDFYPLNVYLIGGIGLNYAWDNDDAYAQKAVMPMAWKDNRLSHNGRVGAMLEWNVHKHWGINLEVAANSLSDRYNSKVNDKDDWSLTAQLGVAYKFGFKKKEKAVAPVVVSSVDEFTDTKETETVAVEPTYATRIDTTWYDDVTYKEVPGVEKLEKNIFFTINEFGVADKCSEVEEVANFVKNHKNCKVIVTGYADKDTGTPAYNLGLSKKRADKVYNQLVEAGVSKKIITKNAKGDTVQPFSDNDRNRVAIIVVSGDGTKQEKVVTKKFRTKEVRYQVK
jgi:outer membrane protein OmpA-like peptidoglycan-associated protein